MRKLLISVAAGVLIGGSCPQPSLADDASRISRLESELQQLRIRIDDQLRRIERLENELDLHRSRPLIRPIPDQRTDGIAAPATGPLPWHAPDSWGRVTKGMSQMQVTKILGPPTTVEASGSYKTLFYRGTVADSGTLRGIVNLLDDRVVAVNAPDFQTRIQ